MIVIRGSDGKPLAVVGVSEVWARDPLATYWKKVKVVMMRVTTLDFWVPASTGGLHQGVPPGTLASLSLGLIQIRRVRRIQILHLSLGLKKL